MDFESYTSWGMLITFLIFGLFFILALSGFGWAAYSIIFAVYYYLFSCVISRKISFSQRNVFLLLSKYYSAVLAGLIIIKGIGAVVLSGLLIFVLTLILLIVHTNIIEFWVVSDFTFQYKINVNSLLTGLPMGIFFGFLYTKFNNNVEKISLEQYGSKIIGD